MGDMFWVARILNNFLGAWNSWYLFWGNDRCWARAYVQRKNGSTPPPLGLKRLVPNYYFSSSCLPLGALVKFPCGGGHSSCNASLRQPNVQKNSRALVMGMGGLKIWKKKINARKTIKSTSKKKNGYRFPRILYFFIHPQPNNIGPARQQPRD